jgi:hypothetical protein
MHGAQESGHLILLLCEAGCRKRAAPLNNAPYLFSTFDWLLKDPGCDQNFKKLIPSPIHVQNFSEVATAIKNLSLNAR